MKVDEHVHRALPIADEPIFRGAGRAPAVWAVAAHGGAGASTLARLWAPCGDAGQWWPSGDEFPWCVVVARSTRRGLDAAQSAVLQARSGNSGGCELLGVVIVADCPGKTPKSLLQRESVLAELTQVWHVPYVAGIRENDIGDLACWSPLDDKDAETSKRRGKKVPITQVVPESIAQVGREIFGAAYAAYTTQEDNS